MARRTGTAATRRAQGSPPAAAPAPQETPQPTGVFADPEMFLEQGGWQRIVGTDTWTHETKAGGNALPVQQAMEFEQRARLATGPDETDDERATREAAERDTADRAAFLANHTAEQTRIRLAEAEALRNRIAEQEAAAIADEPEIGHDRVGRVTLFACYACKFNCRYSPDCDCKTCAKISEQICCPNCGDTQPNVDPRRR